MKLRTAALIAIIGNILGMIFHLAIIWQIIPVMTQNLNQLGWSLYTATTTGTLLLFMISFFNRTK